MKVEIWSDYVCPFCYIGRRRFEKSLEKFPHRQHVSVEYKSYELAPDAVIDPNIKYYDSLATKFGISIEEAILSSVRISRQAKEMGLSFNFERMRPTNTFDAHRLAKFAAKQGKGKEMTERLLRGYFTDALHISDNEILVKLAAEIGLDSFKVKRLLEAEYYSAKVREDEDDAKSMGIKIVPFFVFNEKHAVSGLQTVEMFTTILEQLWESEGKHRGMEYRTNKQIETTYCTGEGCSREENEII